MIPGGGEKVTTFDITITMPVHNNVPNPLGGIGSGLGQRYNIAPDPDTGDPVSSPSPASSSATLANGDSHLIVITTTPALFPLVENNNVPGGPAYPSDTAPVTTASAPC